MIAATSLVKLGVAGTLLLAAPVQARLSAPGHSPKIKTHWGYTVRRHERRQARRPGSSPSRSSTRSAGRTPSSSGRPRRTIANWPFKGAFSDFIIWPGELARHPAHGSASPSVAGDAKKVITTPREPRG